MAKDRVRGLSSGLQGTLYAISLANEPLLIQILTAVQVILDVEGCPYPCV
jgi:hypothetical protein